MNGMSDTNHDIYWIRYRDSRDSLTLSQSDQKRMNEQLLHSFSLLHIMMGNLETRNKKYSTAGQKTLQKG